MKDIFQLAFLVLIWLGAEDGDFFKALNTLEEIDNDKTLLDVERLERDGVRDFNRPKLIDAIFEYPPSGWLPSSHPKDLTTCSISSRLDSSGTSRLPTCSALLRLSNEAV